MSPSPRPDDLPADEYGAGPDTRGPEPAATRGVRDEKLAIGSLKQKVRIAAGEEPCGGRRLRWIAKRRLVTAQDPGLADRRSRRGQRRAQGVKRCPGLCRRDARPSGERRRRRGAEDVQVPARKLAPSVVRVDVGCRHGPDDRCSCALPADHHPPGRCGVPQSIRVQSEPASRLAVGHPPTGEEGVEAGGEVFRDPPAARGVRQPPGREDREVACRYDIRAEARPPELNERRVLPGGRASPLDTRMDRKERRTRHAVLQARPGRTPEGTRAGREPFVERADAPSERQDLRPREVERNTPRSRPRFHGPSQSGYSSFRQVRGSSGWAFGVRSSRKLKYGATKGSGAATV